MCKTGKMRMHRALPLCVTAQVSPSKAEDSNYQVKKELRKELAQMGSNIQLTERHEMRAISRIRRGHIECLGEVEIENDYGELFAWLEAHKYSALRQLPACDFDPYYGSYVMDGLVCNKAREEICYLMASVHGIRNAYRQQASGFPSMCCVDLTHKLVAQGHSVFVFGTRDLAQHYRPTCWGVFSDKGQGMHEFAFALIKKEIEKIVNDESCLYPTGPTQGVTAAPVGA